MLNKIARVLLAALTLILCGTACYIVFPLIVDEYNTRGADSLGWRLKTIALVFATVMAFASTVYNIVDMIDMTRSRPPELGEDLESDKEPV